AAGAAALILALALAGLLFHVVRVAVVPGPRRGHGAAGAEPALERAGDPGPSRRARPSASALLLAVPLAVVVVAGLWTPSPIAAVLDQVVAVLGGGGTVLGGGGG
ncbi:MAG: hypothetical protein AB1627_09895, partial [Chloroflexota bacterium]